MGLLEPLWGAVGGRDKLAELTGIQPGTLSGYNTGRLNLGLKNANKIAAALSVTLLDLGAPEAEDPVEAVTLHDRLEALEARVDLQGESLTKSVDALAREVRALRRRIAQSGESATQDG